jgi:hypothetical protein
LGAAVLAEMVWVCAESSRNNQRVVLFAASFTKRMGTPEMDRDATTQVWQGKSDSPIAAISGSKQGK